MARPCGIESILVMKFTFLLINSEIVALLLWTLLHLLAFTSRVRYKPYRRGGQELLDKLLTKRTVQIVNGNDLNWSDAIKLSAQPLVNNGSVKETYVQAMLDTVIEKGPYFNIGSRIVLAHSRPEAGVNKISLSLLKTDQAVNLVNPDHPVNLWFVLAATDNQTHLSVIQGLMELLMSEQKVQAMCNATKVEQLLEIIGTK